MKQLEVIVVDDQVDLAESTGLLVRLFGHHVLVCNSAQSVLEALDHVMPDLILSDIGMPEMDGMKALKIIKQENPSIRVIMVTAVETQEKIEESMRLGADNYITKPLSLEYLENDVQEKLKGLV